MWFYRLFWIIMEKSIHFMSFSKEIFPTYFENNKNSVES